jgi:hypothetical protein
VLLFGVQGAQCGECKHQEEQQQQQQSAGQQALAVSTQQPSSDCWLVPHHGVNTASVLWQQALCGAIDLVCRRMPAYSGFSMQRAFGFRDKLLLERLHNWP